MSVCSYCSQPSLVALPRRGHQVQVCECRLRLIRHQQWRRLALRWLTHRPQDWVPDVAAWLEYFYGREPHGG